MIRTERYSTGIFTCDKCGETVTVQEDLENRVMVDELPKGWHVVTFGDKSSGRHGELCPRCSINIRAWLPFGF